MSKIFKRSAICHVYLLGAVLIGCGSPTQAQSRTPEYRHFSPRAAPAILVIDLTQPKKKARPSIALLLAEPIQNITDHVQAGWGIQLWAKVGPLRGDPYRYFGSGFITGDYRFGEGNARPSIGLGAGLHSRVKSTSSISNGEKKPIIIGIGISPKIGMELTATNAAIRRKIGHLNMEVIYHVVLHNNIQNLLSCDLSWTFGGKKIPLPPAR